MGSTGSGSFTDYSKRKSTDDSFSNGGSSGEDDCAKGFSTTLEDVSRCLYFINHQDVPSLDTEVKVVFNGVRLSVETLKGEEIGYLPTKFNYIKNCMEQYEYSGVVNRTTLKPLPIVGVDIIPL